MHTHDDDDGIGGREWRLQERADAIERGRTPASDEGARLARYRLIARALRVAPEFDLQADFARDAAREITSIAARSAAARRRFERGVIGALILGYAIVMALAVSAFHAEASAIVTALRALVTANHWWLVGLVAGASVVAGSLRTQASAASRA